MCTLVPLDESVKLHSSVIVVSVAFTTITSGISIPEINGRIRGVENAFSLPMYICMYIHTYIHTHVICMYVCMHLRALDLQIMFASYELSRTRATLPPELIGSAAIVMLRTSHSKRPASRSRSPYVMFSVEDMV
jgi:hypothetical protein